ncbi:ABC-type nitrate transport atp-binding protein [Gloeomargarita lithophora Alchichica-D10]|uniref:ABC-type nitrate transport atp-binding protein n=1 Tax=Gloeomargarita lithophora Alchichica-D10 TaxID=1188229 RepID=A0A1J0ADU2_9CYAN|nr:ABC transporter ATP-binding protein [Gloeomargarita lithophora]APB34079.1 ABC-type nitrate transport atp-binding protein [Gloeomargarita lithophora Alchichica-D10]
MQTLTTQATSHLLGDLPFLELRDVTKSYRTAKGNYTVLEGVNLSVKSGEFVSIIGHSGCGKTTLLNLVAGFFRPSQGEISLENQRITAPGPDRMVVFQHYSLLPWLTAYENIYLGVQSVYRPKSEAEKRQVKQIVNDHLELVGLGDAANKKPKQLSGGMKQRVSIARALAMRPQILLLDEPFGALDPITREELQDQLLDIWRQSKVTVLMITHDVDEAVYLSDRIIMMTNGPAATIGEILTIPFPRPRKRTMLMEDPQFFTLRNECLSFLYDRFALDVNHD